MHVHKTSIADNSLRALSKTATHSLLSAKQVRKFPDLYLHKLKQCLTSWTMKATVLEWFRDENESAIRQTAAGFQSVRIVVANGNLPDCLLCCYVL